MTRILALAIVFLVLPTAVLWAQQPPDLFVERDEHEVLSLLSLDDLDREDYYALGTSRRRFATFTMPILDDIEESGQPADVTLNLFSDTSLVVTLRFVKDEDLRLWTGTVQGATESVVRVFQSKGRPRFVTPGMEMPDARKGPLFAQIEVDGTKYRVRTVGKGRNPSIHIIEELDFSNPFPDIPTFPDPPSGEPKEDPGTEEEVATQQIDVLLEVDPAW